MKIKQKKIKIRDIVNGFVDSQENGCFGFGGNLNIRPKFQREFVYKEEQQKKVVETIFKGFPLNSMYWVINEDGTYELLDGQQRTISFAKYYQGNFSIGQDKEGTLRYFDNLTPTEQKKFLDYPIYVYVCEGKKEEKLEWFKVINFAGEKLTTQELRNAIYTGPWLSDAKYYFSRPSSGAKQVIEDYIKLVSIRQEYLELALKWIVIKEKTTIEKYMATNQHKANASQIWTYFNQICDWIKDTFNPRPKLMKKVDWGKLYHLYRKKIVNKEELETQIKTLLEDEEVAKKHGVYFYLFDNNEKHLGLRTFSEKDKVAQFEKQKHTCNECKRIFKYEEMEGDHIKPWSKGGKTNKANLQMLCLPCNRQKGAK